MNTEKNLRAIFEILSYLHVDAVQDGYPDLAERLEFTMNCAERHLKELKQAEAAVPELPV
ncbi:hypothetical protein [Sneathiella chinensis]|nr:hypothetical protein [Sneathiella chinensis]